MTKRFTGLGGELRPLIGQAVAGSIGRRGVGVLLFAAGLVVQTAGNLAAL